jgi:NAD(P)H dehydrogenase (quinone)
MGDINALVVFYSRYGRTEKLALAAGLGAIQAEANIRLRRVADHADAATIGADANWKQNLDRMNRDYVVPRPADPVWADVIILATPAESSRELEAYVASLSSLGSMAGKIAAPLAPGNGDAALKPIYSASACCGLIVTPCGETSSDAVGTATMFGQRVIEMARALKRGLGVDPFHCANGQYTSVRQSAGSG